MPVTQADLSPLAIAVLRAVAQWSRVADRRLAEHMQHAGGLLRQRASHLLLDGRLGDQFVASCHVLGGAVGVIALDSSTTKKIDPKKVLKVLSD